MFIDNYELSPREKRLATYYADKLTNVKTIVREDKKDVEYGPGEFKSPLKVLEAMGLVESTISTHISTDSKKKLNDISDQTKNKSTKKNFIRKLLCSYI